jgi:hypothetical protein
MVTAGGVVSPASVVAEAVTAVLIQLVRRAMIEYEYAVDVASPDSVQVVTAMFVQGLALPGEVRVTVYEVAGAPPTGAVQDRVMLALVVVAPTAVTGLTTVAFAVAVGLFAVMTHVAYAGAATPKTTSSPKAVAVRRGPEII